MKQNNTIVTISDLTQRVLNAKVLADGLFDSIMQENFESDAPLSFTIMLKEQLGSIEELVDSIKPMEVSKYEER